MKQIILNVLPLTIAARLGFIDGTTFCLGSSTTSNISLQNTNNMQNSDHWGYLYEATVNGNSVNCSSTIKANILRWYDKNKDEKMSITYNNGTWTIRRPNLGVQNGFVAQRFKR